MANSPLCSIAGCGKAVIARGWCVAHYTKWRRHGSPLSGGTYAAAQKFFRDAVLAYDGDECLLWPFTTNQKGYAEVYHDGKLKVVSRLVCEHVNGPPPTPLHQASHSCGKGHLSCVSKRHLVWKTPVDNQADRVTHGTHFRGQQCGGAKLTEDDVREIWALQGSMPQIEIARRFGVSRRAVGAIYSGKNWGWLP